MSSDHRDGRAIRFFFHFNNQTSLYRSIKLQSNFTPLKHEVNNRCFIFEGIQRWPVINLVSLIHGYSYLISLEIVVGYRKLRSFQGTQVNFSVTRESRYQVFIAKLLIRISRAKLHNLFENLGPC